ncbi:MAG: DMT family transporter [Candidatus Aminicenantes bacterium]|nr:DMT family transporter [Candidatus Aminicenantes bacterium]
MKTLKKENNNIVDGNSGWFFSRWRQSDLLMFVAVLIWGINLSIVKIALTEFPPYFFNFLRLVGASFVLLIYLIITGEKISVPKFNLYSIVFIGFLGNTLYQIFFIKGVSLTTASNASLIMTSSPLFIALLSTLLKHEHLARLNWLGLFLSLFGLYLVITQRSGDFSLSSRSLQGDILILLANLCWAGYTIYSRPYLEIMSPAKLAALTMMAGTLFYLPFGFLDIKHFSWSNISWKGWLALVFSFVFALGISFVIWYNSLRSVGNSRTAIYSYLTPLVALLTAHFTLNERITIIQGLGGLIVLFGFSLTRSGLWWRRLTKKSSPA